MSDINIDLSLKDLPQLIGEVTETLVLKEIEVQDREGKWYSLRIRPYKTPDSKIDGVVLTLFDIDKLKRTLAQVEEARLLAEAVIDTSREPLAVLTPGLEIERANEAFYQLFRTTKEQAERRRIEEIITHPGEVELLQQSLKSVLEPSGSLTNQEARIDLPQVGPTSVKLSARRVASAGHNYPLILLSIRSD